MKLAWRSRQAASVSSGPPSVTASTTTSDVSLPATSKAKDAAAAGVTVREKPKLESGDPEKQPSA